VRLQAASSSEALRLKGGSFLGNIKNALFPIEGWEMPKFFSMSAMMFMIIYIYTTVRDTKDTLVVSACGAESITFLKVYGVLPAATMFMVLYSKLSSMFSKDQLFYVTATPFFIFYGLFAFVLYPNRDLIHPEMPPAVLADERCAFQSACLQCRIHTLPSRFHRARARSLSLSHTHTSCTRHFFARKHAHTNSLLPLAFTHTLHFSQISLLPRSPFLPLALLLSLSLPCRLQLSPLRRPTLLHTALQLQRLRLPPPMNSKPNH